MRLGVIADIHGNFDALTAVLADMGTVDRVLCLGDLVGYGPEPNECCARIRQLPGLVCVAGNHDLAAIGRVETESFNPWARAAVEWTALTLAPEQATFLAGLPLTAQVNGITLVHGLLPEPMDYLQNTTDAARMFDAMTTPVGLVGHTHLAEYYLQEPDGGACRQIPLWEGGEVMFRPDCRYIVNCGGVGQPRDGNPKASYGIVDSDLRGVFVRRVAYPVERVQAKMLAAGLPEPLARRLSVGR